VGSRSKKQNPGFETLVRWEASPANLKHMSDKYLLTKDMLVHHITVNGKPYCQEENVNFSGYHYPTNCGHGSKASAEKGVEECKKLRPDLEYKVVEGPCHSDPFWQTPEGREIIAQEEEMNEMRWQD
jgi:hypothetical protein